MRYDDEGLDSEDDFIDDDIGDGTQGQQPRRARNKIRTDGVHSQAVQVSPAQASGLPASCQLTQGQTAHWQHHATCTYVQSACMHACTAAAAALRAFCPKFQAQSWHLGLDHAPVMLYTPAKQDTQHSKACID